MRDRGFGKVHLIASLLVISLVAFATGHANEVELVEITNEESPKVFRLSVELDEQGDVKYLVRRSFNENNKLEQRTKFEAELIQTDRGVILDEERGHVVVSLRSQNFEPHNGGHVEIDTLYNGARGTRKSYEIEFVREGESWAIYHQGEPVTSLHFKSKKVLFIGTVGIEDIVFKDSSEFATGYVSF